MENTNNTDETYYRSFPNLSKELREYRTENREIQQDIETMNKETELMRQNMQALDAVHKDDSASKEHETEK